MTKLNLQRVIKRRKTEIVITIGLLLFSVTLLILSLALPKETLASKIGEKFSFPIFVALILRWLTVWFSEIEPKEDLYGSNFVEYHEAIRKAGSRIWILQTWLPGVERDAEEILQRKISDTHVMLASFKPKSPIFARIAGRGIPEAKAKAYVQNSVKPFLRDGRKECLKFNCGHYPGWIAVIDSFVFWGPTPLHADNQSQDIFFHKDAVNGVKGAFWADQFDRLWKGFGHGFDDETHWNKELHQLESPDQSA